MLILAEVTAAELVVALNQVLWRDFAQEAM
jgi:hypothetical protein